MAAADGSSTRSDGPNFMNGTRTGYQQSRASQPDFITAMHEHIDKIQQQNEENNLKIKRLTEENSRLDAENKSLKSRISDLERYGHSSHSSQLVEELKRACVNFLNYEDNGISGGGSSNDLAPLYGGMYRPNAYQQTPSIEGTCPKLMSMFNECSTSRRLRFGGQRGNSVNPPSSVSPMTSQSPTPPDRSVEDATNNVAINGDISVNNTDTNHFSLTKDFPQNIDVEGLEQTTQQQQQHSQYDDGLQQQPQNAVVAGPQTGIGMNGVNGVNGTNGMQNNRRTYNNNNLNKTKKSFTVFVSWQGGTMTQQALRELFRTIEVKEIRPSQTKSFAHIDMYNTDGMNRAISEYNGKQHPPYGTLRVEKGKPRVPGTPEKPQNQQGPHHQNNRRNDYHKPNYPSNGIMNHGNGSQSQIDPGQLEAVNKWNSFANEEERSNASQLSVANSADSKSAIEDAN